MKSLHISNLLLVSLSLVISNADEEANRSRGGGLQHNFVLRPLNGRIAIPNGIRKQALTRRQPQETDNHAEEIIERSPTDVSVDPILLKDLFRMFQDSQESSHLEREKIVGGKINSEQVQQSRSKSHRFAIPGIRQPTNQKQKLVPRFTNLGNQRKVVERGRKKENLADEKQLSKLNAQQIKSNLSLRSKMRGRQGNFTQIFKHNKPPSIRNIRIRPKITEKGINHFNERLSHQDLSGQVNKPEAETTKTVRKKLKLALPETPRISSFENSVSQLNFGNLPKMGRPVIRIDLDDKTIQSPLQHKMPVKRKRPKTKSIIKSVGSLEQNSIPVQGRQTTEEQNIIQETKNIKQGKYSERRFQIQRNLLKTRNSDGHSFIKQQKIDGHKNDNILKRRKSLRRNIFPKVGSETGDHFMKIRKKNKTGRFAVGQSKIKELQKNENQSDEFLKQIILPIEVNKVEKFRQTDRFFKKKKSSEISRVAVGQIRLNKFKQGGRGNHPVLNGKVSAEPKGFSVGQNRSKNDELVSRRKVFVGHRKEKESSQGKSDENEFSKTKAAILPLRSLGPSVEAKLLVNKKQSTKRKGTIRKKLPVVGIRQSAEKELNTNSETQNIIIDSKNRQSILTQVRRTKPVLKNGLQSRSRNRNKNVNENKSRLNSTTSTTGVERSRSQSGPDLGVINSQTGTRLHNAKRKQPSQKQQKGQQGSTSSNVNIQRGEHIRNQHKSQIPSPIHGKFKRRRPQRIEELNQTHQDNVQILHLDPIPNQVIDVVKQPMQSVQQDTLKLSEVAHDTGTSLTNVPFTAFNTQRIGEQKVTKENELDKKSNSTITKVLNQNSQTDSQRQSKKSINITNHNRSNQRNFKTIATHRATSRLSKKNTNVPFMVFNTQKIKEQKVSKENKFDQKLNSTITNILNNNSQTNSQRQSKKSINITKHNKSRQRNLKPFGTHRATSNLSPKNRKSDTPKNPELNLSRKTIQRTKINNKKPSIISRKSYITKTIQSNLSRNTTPKPIIRVQESILSRKNTPTDKESNLSQKSNLVIIGSTEVYHLPILQQEEYPEDLFGTSTEITPYTVDIALKHAKDTWKQDPYREDSEKGQNIIFDIDYSQDPESELETDQSINNTEVTPIEIETERISTIRAQTPLKQKTRNTTKLSPNTSRRKGRIDRFEHSTKIRNQQINLPGLLGKPLMDQIFILEEIGSSSFNKNRARGKRNPKENGSKMSTDNKVEPQEIQKSESSRKELENVTYYYP